MTWDVEDIRSEKFEDLLRRQITLLESIDEKLGKLAECVERGNIHVMTGFDPPLVYRTKEVTDEEYEKIIGRKRRY
jgi:hypothetical protein